MSDNFMKQILFTLLISLSIIGLGQDITVEFDTLDISRNGQLTEVAFFNDNFYFLFETSRRNTTAWFKSIKVYNTAGDFVENVFLPKEAISMPYCDFRISNKRLYLKQEHSFSGKTFLLEKYVADFNQVPDEEICIYEDSSFCIYPNCHGEWGASTYFRNKQDNKVYEFSSSCNINITRTEDGYLITYQNEIFIIKDPAKLYESEMNFDISYIERMNQGFDSFFKSDFDLYTTFEIGHKLMVIYGDSVKTHIGELRNGGLESVFTFKEPYRFSHWFTDNNSSSQILCMYTYKSISDFGILEGYEMLGLLLINKKKIGIYYIK